MNNPLRVHGPSVFSRLFLVLAALWAPPVALAADLPIGRLGHAAADAGSSWERYLAWKIRYLKQGTCRADERYIDSSGHAGRDGDITVSEAHGYGMLALVSMSATDGDAHDDFDRMVNFMLRMQAGSALPLMPWRITADCEPAYKASSAPESSAPDGDMDMAFALLKAEQRWGNDGAHDYGALAREKIDAVMNHVVQGADTEHPVLGLFEDIDASSPYYGGTRTSDYMMAHFARFARASGDCRWTALADNSYRILKALQDQSPSGLLPDFAVVRGDEVAPAKARYLEGALDGGFGYNACRTPWRLAAAFRASQDERAQALLTTLLNAELALSNGDPKQLADGYTLAGWKVGPSEERLAFVAPAAFGLASLKGFAFDAYEWRKWVRQVPVGQGYFDDTVALLTLLPE